MDPADVGNLESRLISRRDAEFALTYATEWIERIRSLFTDSPKEMCCRLIGVHQIAFSFLGLEFARWVNGEIFFGFGRSRQQLTPAKMANLQKIARDLEIYRHPSATKKTHPLFRAAPERWLETIVQENPTGLDAQLDERFIYSQTPAFEAGDRGVLDLLAVTRNGRLVIIELKATEDIQMPLQALDYWFRVRRHQREGNFQEYGYFIGKDLSTDPPLICLVAPALHFHPAVDMLAKYLDPEICITKIGLGENWRRGLKVTFRQVLGKRL